MHHRNFEHVILLVLHVEHPMPSSNYARKMPDKQKQEMGVRVFLHLWVVVCFYFFYIHNIMSSSMLSPRSATVRPLAPTPAAPFLASTTSTPASWPTENRAVEKE